MENYQNASKTVPTIIVIPINYFPEFSAYFRKALITSQCPDG